MESRCWLLIFYVLVKKLFKVLKKWATLQRQDVSLYVQTFQVVPTKTILPFFAKRRKNVGTCFFYFGENYEQYSRLAQYILF